MTDVARHPSQPVSSTGRIKFAQEHAELAAWVEQTPRYATVKGMYVDSFLNIVERCGAPRPTDKRFFSFKDYPLGEVMGMMLESVTTIYPETSPKEGLTRLGRHAYPTLVGTTIGKIMFSVAGRNWARALNLVPKAWEVSLKPGAAQLVELTDTTARIELRQVWNFPDTYQVGIFQGAMETFGLRGTVRPEFKGRRCDVDILMQWES